MRFSLLLEIDREAHYRIINMGSSRLVVAVTVAVFIIVSKTKRINKSSAAHWLEVLADMWRFWCDCDCDNYKNCGNSLESIQRAQTCSIAKNRKLFAKIRILFAKWSGENFNTIYTNSVYKIVYEIFFSFRRNMSEHRKKILSQIEKMPRHKIARHS